MLFRSRDANAFLKQISEIPDVPPFAPALLGGKLEEAAGKIIEANTNQAVIDHGLVYLAARKAKKAKLADQEWQKFLTALGKGGRVERQFASLLAAGKPVEVEQVRRLIIDPEIKRVVVAAVATRSPDKVKELQDLARKLDYQRDLTSLCLSKVL